MRNTEVEHTAPSSALTLDDEPDSLVSGHLPNDAHPARFNASARLGRFVLLRHVGSGGMGEVYAGYDEQLDRRVALKVLRTDASERTGARGRLLREAQVLARLSHPNVVQVHEIGVHEEQVFIVMEFVEGLTLRGWLHAQDPATDGVESGEQERAQGEAPPTNASVSDGVRPRPRSRQALLDVFVEAGRGLAAAHSMGLVHRDFKPGNVMVGVDGRVRVLDFGLARPGEDPEPEPRLDGVDGMDGVDEDSEQLETLDGLTRTGMALGTPAYMAPEQFAGAEIDARTDQFSFCVALYEALYGERPFDGSSLATLMVSVRRGEMRPPPPEHDVPAWLRTVLLRGLSLNPSERFESMDALLHALTHDPALVWRRRLRVVASMVLVGVVVAVAIFGGLELRARWQEEQRQATAEEDLDRLELQIAQLRAEGDSARARRLFEDFVARPELQDTEALARAWLGEAERRRADDAFEDAQSAYARAYLRARDGTLEAKALVGLAQGFGQRLDWAALSQVLDMLEQHHPAILEDSALREIRLDAALLARDLVAARRLLDAEGDPQDLRLHALDALQGATATPYRNVSFAWPFDLEGDGTQELLLRDEHDGSLRVVRADPSLEELVVYPIGEGRGYPVPPGHGLPGMFVEVEGDELVLSQLLGDGSWAERLRWKEGTPQSVTAGDLDGDGDAEIFVGTSPTTRRIVRLDRDGHGQWSWSSPVPKAEASLSDTMKVEAADLDGDGRPELVAGTSDWIAYDVRVLRAQSDGLRLVAREQLGPIHDVEVMRNAAGEALIVANKIGGKGNTVIFPPDRPSGEPVGLYVLRLLGDRLERVAYVPVPHAAPSRGNAQVLGLEVGDVDGNGLDDLIVQIERLDGSHIWVQLQSPSGSFTPLLLGNARIRAVVELDGDEARELLVDIEDDQGVAHLWILGHGEQAPPLQALAPEPPLQVPEGDVEPELAASWERAGELEGMGLFAEAALAFEDIAIASARVGPAARLRAAALRERAGDDRAALELLSRVRVDGDPQQQIEALRGALRLQVREGAYEPVQELADALLARPEVVDPERGSLVALRDQLADVVRGDARLELRFDRPVPPALEIHQPLAVRRDPTTDALEVFGFLTGEVASLPVTWSGGHLSVEVDWSIPRAEWGAGLVVELVPEAGGDPVLWLQERAEGGADRVSLEMQCTVEPEVTTMLADVEGAHAKPGEVERVVMRALLTPAVQERRVSIFDAGVRVSDQRSHVPFAAPPPGDFRLVLRAYDEWGSNGWNEVRIHRITAAGLRVREPAPEPRAPLTVAGRAFVEGDYRVAAEVLAGVPQPSPSDRAMYAHALMMLGRVREGQEVLDTLIREVDQDASARALTTLLRMLPVLYGPLLRDRMGPQYSALAYRAWALALLFHADEPAVQREVLGLLGELEPDGLDEVAVSRLVQLRLSRADVLAEVGKPEAASRELDSVLALLEQQPPPRREAVRLELELRRAAIEVDAGELEHARARVRRVLEASPRRMYLEDQLRAHPRLSRVYEEPDAR